MHKLKSVILGDMWIVIKDPIHPIFVFEKRFSVYFGIPKVLEQNNLSSLKLTCHHINRRHFCFNIKSISVHPLLWMNVMHDFICMVFAGMWTTFR